MKCRNCGRTVEKHIGRELRCPKNLTIDLNADNITRFQRTGHPKLIGMAFGHIITVGIFDDVTIHKLTVNGVRV